MSRSIVACIVLCVVCILFSNVHAAENSLTSDSNSSPATRQTSLTTASKSSVSNRDQITYINDYIRQGWKAHDLTPSPSATDGEWCRRVFLDVLGRIPSVDELEKFERDRSPEKKQNLVNRLLSDEYVEEYARNWSNIWTTVLIGRPPTMPDRKSLVDRDGMEKYLRDTFARNKPYDQLVRELVTATGSNKPGEEDFHGEVNFLIGNMEEMGVNATARTAKIFLGLQVQCTQCHDHPFNDWKQNQFWELNAFFRQTKAVREGGGPKKRPDPTAELTSVNFAGEGKDPSKAVLFYDLKNGLVKSALPVFVDGTEINPSGKLGAVNRRNELAKLITNSDYMKRAIVNRMWGHFLGYGFTKPIDDMGPNNPPSHPDLLNKLADDFATHSYDLKQLIRWIVLSDPYGLSSKMAKSKAPSGKEEKYEDKPANGFTPMFSHFYLRQMTPEQLYESLLVATAADKTFRTSEEQQKNKEQWLRQFTITFGTDEGDDSTTFNGTIPQTLMMFNGELVKKATSAEAGSFLDRIAKDAKMPNAAKINYLFMAALARKPNHEEIDWANKLLLARKGDPGAALQDVFWVALNTGEFILNH